MKLIQLQLYILFFSIINALQLNAQTGIGTTTPVNKFQVETAAAAPLTTGTGFNGNLRLGATGANQVFDFGLGTAYGWLQARDKTGYGTNYNLLLNPNGGNVGIGSIVAPTVRLQVNGDIIANSVAGPSDIRYKKDIHPLTGSLKKVLQLRGVSFYWNLAAYPEKEFSNQKEIGFIAQELEKVIPEIVSADKTPEAYRTVKYDKLVALLVEAIKEQQKQIDKLKIEVKQLKRNKK